MLSVETPFILSAPGPKHWMSMPLGRTGSRLAAIASFWNNEQYTYDINEIRVQIRLVGKEANSLYTLLMRQKDEIEEEVGEPMEWINPEDSKACRIYLARSARLNQQDQWSEYFQWLKDKLDLFYSVFRDRVRHADLAEFEQGEEV